FLHTPYFRRYLCFLTADGHITLTSSICCPEISVSRATVGTEHHRDFMHTLNKSAGTDGLIIRVGNDDQCASQQLCDVGIPQPVLRNPTLRVGSSCAISCSYSPRYSRTMRSAENR